MSKKRTNEEFLIEISKLNPTYSILSEYVNCDTKVDCHCNIHNVNFSTAPYYLLNGQIGCELCRREKIGRKNRRTKQDLIDRLSQINHNIEIVGEYTQCKNKIECRCKSHNEKFFITPDHLIQGQSGCSQCIKQKNHMSGLKQHEEFISQMQMINTDILILGQYNGAKDRIKVRCKICEYEWQPQSSSLIQGYGCPKCANKQVSERQTKDLDIFLKDLQYWNPNIIYLDGYTKVSSQVHVKCKICGHEWRPIGTAITNKHPSGCPVCCMSHGEKRIYSFLLSRDISCIPQCTFDDLLGQKNKPLSYDFYIPKYNLLIEYQGEFHDGTVHFQTEEMLKSQKNRDIQKRNYAIANGYNFLEIWYWDYDNVDAILSDTINNLENSVETTVI